jgi:hypothetical protein
VADSNSNTQYLCIVSVCSCISPVLSSPGLSLTLPTTSPLSLFPNIIGVPDLQPEPAEWEWVTVKGTTLHSWQSTTFVFLLLLYLRDWTTFLFLTWNQTLWACLLGCCVVASSLQMCHQKERRSIVSKWIVGTRMSLLLIGSHEFSGSHNPSVDCSLMWVGKLYTADMLHTFCMKLFHCFRWQLERKQRSKMEQNWCWTSTITCVSNVDLRASDHTLQWK